MELLIDDLFSTDTHAHIDVQNISRYDALYVLSVVIAKR